RQKFLQRFTGFGLALLGAIVLYAPWLVVLVNNADRATATTDWTRYAPGLDYLIKLWTLSFTSLFLDLDFGFNNPVTYLLRVPIVLLIGAALYTLCRRSERSVWVCVLTSILVPFLVLALPDLLLGGKRSAVSRYLISCYPGVQLAIAAFFSVKLAEKETSPQSAAPLWRGTLALLLTASVVSCTVSALSFTWWNKDLSYFNAETARRINAVPSAIVVSDIGNDFTNTGDLISLSYLLKPDVRLLLLKEAAWVQTTEFSEQIKGSTPIVFRPSQRLRESLKPNALTPFLPEAHVWRLSQ
ncbi:glycosyl transferase family 39, partial [Leptolyngbya sp. FACHB-36]|nr:glycosyl transferase family 39 [Leptolyngbya sp. FACHB-36]